MHVAKGALARIPGYFCAQDFLLPEPADTFACLAETYVLARQGLFEHSLGRPTAEYARRVQALAERYDVVPRSIVPDLERCQALRGQPADSPDSEKENVVA